MDLLRRKSDGLVGNHSMDDEITQGKEANEMCVCVSNQRLRLNDARILVQSDRSILS